MKVLTFKEFLEQDIIAEGGNVTQINYKTGEEARQEKIPISVIGVDNFRKKSIQLFIELNKIFKKMHGYPLWADESIIHSGYVFNGSTSYVLNPSYLGSEIQAIKPEVGDIDITVPESYGKELFQVLDTLLSKEIIKGVTYMGSNRTTVTSIGNQINSVFKMEFGSLSVFQQVDFELLPFQGQKPTEWQKFSHGSSFEDQKAQLKAVNHKYLIRQIVGSQNRRDDIIVQTPSSTPDNLRFKRIKGNPVTVENMTKFSVVKGVRVQFEPMLDQVGKPMFYRGPETGNKRFQILKEIPTSQSTFQTDIESIYILMFGDTQDKDLSKMHSFVGIVSLMKKYLKKDQIERQNERYQELLWGKGQQELERGEPTWDYEIKKPQYEYFIKELRQKNLSLGLIDSYYQSYRV